MKTNNQSGSELRPDEQMQSGSGSADAPILARGVASLKKLTFTQQAGIFITAVGASLMIGGEFIVCIDAFIWGIGQALRLPATIEIGLMIPATLTGFWITWWMFLRVYRSEIRFAQGEADEFLVEG